MSAIARPPTPSWQRCHDIARSRGLAPALAALHAALPIGASVFGSGGAAVLPDGPVECADARVVRTAALPGGPVLLVRTGRPGGDVDPVLAVGSVWLRLGLSEALLDACLRHLGERRSGDTTLLRQQMVQDAIAVAVTGQLEIRAELVAHDPERPPAAVLCHLHTRLTEVDRGLLRLLGASGFLVAGPGEVADVSELVAGAYTPAEVTV